LQDRLLPAVLSPGPGIEYFEVQPPRQDQEGLSTVPVDSGTAWARVGKQMAKAWENIEK
jgi:hypothetical protein